MNHHVWIIGGTVLFFLVVISLVINHRRKQPEESEVEDPIVDAIVDCLPAGPENMIVKEHKEKPEPRKSLEIPDKTTKKKPKPKAKPKAKKKKSSKKKGKAN